MRSIKNGIQDKAVKNKPFTSRQLQRNRLVTKSRYGLERTFGSQARWFGSKVLRYQGLVKAVRRQLTCPVRGQVS